MTRSLTLCAFFLSAFVLQACSDVPIGDSRARDASPDVATCSGANPAAKKCRTSASECIPSTCSCSTDGFWHCTADCPVDVPLCADGGVPEVAVPDMAPDAVICGGANPAAQTCRKTANDCIPSTCSCSTDGFWHCTADCPVSVPLCADGGAPDLASDLSSVQSTDGYVFPPTDEQSCLKATKVGVCDIWSPYGTITSATGGPLIAIVQVTSGPCSTTSSCASGCASVSVVGQSSVLAGSTCDLLVTSTDGRSKSVRLSVVDNPSPSYMCCGYPADGHGIWTVVNAYNFQPNPVVVDFAGDGGAGNGDLGGESAANPCAQCGTSEVCVQSFDGTCRLGTITCRPASTACRTKLTASGVKDCKAISECETEFCTSPMRCVYNPPCGTEAPEAQLYCYGP